MASVIPSTAGKVLTENELRAHFKCSQFYFFGGTFEEPVLIQIVRETIEYMTVRALKEGVFHPRKTFTPYLQRVMMRMDLERTMTEGEIDHLHRGAVYWLNNFWTYYKPSRYLPVLAAIPYRVRVRRTPIDLHLSAIFRNIANQTLHVLHFSPYQTPHGMLNDPVVHLKIPTIKPYVKKFGSRAQVRVHLLGANANVGGASYNQHPKFLQRTLDSEEANPQYLTMIRGVIDSLESGVHYPVVPCKYKCPFTTRCFPYGGDSGEK